MKNVLVLLFLLTGSLFSELSSQNLQNSIAVFDLTVRNAESNDAQLFSAEHIAKITGVPYVVTQDLSEAISHGMILSSSLFLNNKFTEEEVILLETYVNNGGILIAPRIQETDFFPLFGIEDYENSNSRYAIHWDSTSNDPSLKYINTTEERTLSLGRTTYDQIYKTLGYTTTTAQTLASFTDGTAAVTENVYGAGAAITIGVSWKEVILRNQLNRDFEAHRVSSNGFEPTSDVLSLFVRALFMKYNPYTVWKNTSPGRSDATLMITHDIDSKTGMDTLRVFADYENQQNFAATYNVTVRYFSDALMGDYYLGEQSTIDYILDRGHNIGSHSVGHFFDFADPDIFPIGSSGNTQANYTPHNDGDITEGGTVYGECEVSKNILENDIPGLSIRSFRAGHLAYPEYLVNVLDELGYKFNSSYSASDVLNNFPFQNKKDRSFSGENSNVYELPVTLSDVYHDDPISAENIYLKADAWLETTQKNLENGAPTVLLIHPNRHYKLEGLKYYLDRVPESINMMELEAFGDFWLARENQTFSTEVIDGEMIIRLTSQMDISQNLSFVINDGQALASIIVVDEAGNSVERFLKDKGSEDVVVYFQDNSTALEKTVKKSYELEVFPNPTMENFTLRMEMPDAGQIEIEMYDIYGSRISTLFNEQVNSQKLDLNFSMSEIGAVPGVHFLVLNNNGKMIGRKAIVFLE